jgi:hypothetical protein
MRRRSPQKLRGDGAGLGPYCLALVRLRVHRVQTLRANQLDRQLGLRCIVLSDSRQPIPAIRFRQFEKLPLPQSFHKPRITRFANGTCRRNRKQRGKDYRTS